MENELVVICALIISCLVASDCLRAICNRLRTLLKKRIFCSITRPIKEKLMMILDFYYSISKSSTFSTHFYLTWKEKKEWH